jgi:hypothetical protein
VDANNFGVLQKENVLFILGWKKELNPTLPDLEKHKIPRKAY